MVCSSPGVLKQDVWFFVNKTKSSIFPLKAFKGAPFEEKHRVPGQCQGASSASGATVLVRAPYRQLLIRSRNDS